MEASSLSFPFIRRSYPQQYSPISLRLYPFRRPGANENARRGCFLKGVDGPCYCIDAAILNISWTSRLDSISMRVSPAYQMSRVASSYLNSCGSGLLPVYLHPLALWHLFHRAGPAALGLVRCLAY